MRILVTGGAGFIGSHLCERLLKDGHEVFCIDNFITGRFKNIEHFKNEGRFHLLEHDITLPLRSDLIRNEDLRFIENREGKIDQIYHLACPSSPIDEQDIPLQILWINAAGTKNMLELAVRHDANFLLASCAEVYGNVDLGNQLISQKISESFQGNIDQLAPLSAIQQGKIFAESLGMNYYRHFRFGLKIGRIFETYGPRMRTRDGTMISEYIHAAKHDEPLRIPVLKNESAMINVCFVDDIVEGLIGLMNTPKDFLGPVNLGSPELYSLQDIAHKIIEITGSSSLVVEVPLEKKSKPTQIPDIALAQQKFGFHPKVGLELGIKNSAASYRVLDKPQLTER